jgi:hypothetical protein
MFKTLSTERFCTPHSEFRPWSSTISQLDRSKEVDCDTEYQREIGSAVQPMFIRSRIKAQLSQAEPRWRQRGC